MKKIKLFILIFVLLSVACLCVNVLCDRTGKSDGEIVEIKVEEGTSLNQIAEELKNQGIIGYKTFFINFVKERGMDRDIKAGRHIMSKNMGYLNVAQELVSNGDAEHLIKLTVPEGFEIYKTAERVEKLFDIPKKVFLKTADDGTFEFVFLEGVPHRDNRLEGYLFPDTYILEKDASAEDIINMMLSTFERIWSEEYENRATELGMTMDDIIKLASIIEREAANTEEMKKVSSVFHNRINAGMPLQSCATVQYILKERKPVLSIEDTKIDSPYNTYVYSGLPKGPIASPGEAAIKAALYPDETDYYYFKLNDEGVTVFSKTLDEHNKK